MSVAKVKKDEIKLISLLKCEVGLGTTTRFWLDDWNSRGCLKNVFPNLFKLEKKKSCLISDRIKKDGWMMGWSWDWVRKPSSTEEEEEWKILFGIVSEFLGKDRIADRWSWKFSNNGKFSVAGVRRWLVSGGAGHISSHHVWPRWIPRKVRIHMWRVNLNRIPTAEALLGRHIQVSDDRCALCKEEVESVDHLYSGCRVSGEVWDKLAVWWKIDSFYGFSFNHLVSSILFQLGAVHSKLEQEVIAGLFAIACWQIWKARNGIIFAKKEWSVEEVIGNIKYIGHLWFVRRFKVKTDSWGDWCRCPLSCM